MKVTPADGLSGLSELPKGVVWGCQGGSGPGCTIFEEMQTRKPHAGAPSVAWCSSPLACAGRRLNAALLCSGRGGVAALVARAGLVLSPPPSTCLLLPTCPRHWQPMLLHPLFYHPLYIFLLKRYAFPTNCQTKTKQKMKPLQIPVIFFHCIELPVFCHLLSGHLPACLTAHRSSAKQGVVGALNIREDTQGWLCWRSSHLPYPHREIRTSAVHQLYPLEKPQSTEESTRLH